jgi:branched-chain amino acid aminotransferase
MQKPIVYINGLFWPIDKANISVLDRGFAYGDGLFETMRSYSGKIFRIGCHLDRLFRSARSIFIDLPMTKNEIQTAINGTIQLNKLSNSIARLTITRGTHDPGLNIDYNAAPTVVILVRATKVISKNIYKKGIGIKLYKKSAIRTQGISTQIKSCNYLSNILLREKALKEGFFEAILLDNDNNATEGTISNIFIVKNKQLRTPSLNEFVLGGIIRKAILDICRTNNISFQETTITEKDLYEADEIFLTNSGIEVLPVSNINHRHLKDVNRNSMTTHIHSLLLKVFEEPFKK